MSMAWGTVWEPALTHVHVCDIPCRYMKGTQDRGFILGSVDDIVLSLDDNAMNLQSMSASRYVGPFFEKVQKWEKSLSHISEVVDVSLACELYINLIMP